MAHPMVDGSAIIGNGPCIVPKWSVTSPSNQSIGKMKTILGLSSLKNSKQILIENEDMVDNGIQ